MKFYGLLISLFLIVPVCSLATDDNMCSSEDFLDDITLVVAGFAMAVFAAGHQPVEQEVNEQEASTSTSAINRKEKSSTCVLYRCDNN